jgi:serine/threonine-protein kinase HipA
VRRSIKVFVGDDPRLIGMIRYSADGARESAAFEYDASWLSARDRFSIDPSLQLVPGPQFHKKARDGSIFHPSIADTEPDGWGRRVILRDHAKRMQEARRAGTEFDTRPLNDLDFLLEVDDASRVGALRFQDEEGHFQCTPEPGRRTASPLGRDEQRNRGRPSVPARARDLARRPAAEMHGSGREWSPLDR